MHVLGLLAAAAMMPLAADPSELRSGTISVVAGGDQATTAEVAQIYTDAVEHALLRTRLVLLPNPSHSRYIARVEVLQTPRGVVASDGRQSAAVPTMAYGGGGLSLSLPSKNAQLRGLVETRLKISVSLRSDDRVAWTGEALTVRASGTRNGDIAVIATTLSDALFAHFPHRLYEPLSVP